MKDEYKAKSMEMENGKKYTTVNERIKEFKSTYPFGGIKIDVLSNIESLNKGMLVIVKAAAYRYPNDPMPGTGMGTAIYGDGDFGKVAVENAETSAKGRALGDIGIGLTENFASADEVDVAVGQNKEIKNAEKPIPKAEAKPVEKATVDTAALDKNEKEEADSIISFINEQTSMADLRDLKKTLQESQLSAGTREVLYSAYNTKLKQLKAIEPKKE